MESACILPEQQCKLRLILSGEEVLYDGIPAVPAGKCGVLARCNRGKEMMLKKI